jgi:hypothetical protein
MEKEMVVMIEREMQMNVVPAAGSRCWYIEVKPPSPGNFRAEPPYCHWNNSAGRHLSGGNMC